MSLPDLPTIPSSQEPNTKRAIDMLRVLFNSLKKKGGLVAVNDLVDAGLVDSSLQATGSEYDGAIPPAIVGLTATGAFRTIILEWDAVNFRNYSYVELWRSTTDDLGTAVKIGTTTATLYSDLPPNASLAVTYYYWARVVSRSNLIGPFNATSGTSATTANDPAYVIEILENQLTENELYGDLQSRINLIDTTGTGLIDRMVSVEAGVETALANGISTAPFDENDTYIVGALVSYDNSIYKCILEINSTPAPIPTNETYWVLIGNYATLADMVSANAASLVSLDSEVDGIGSTVAAHSGYITALETTVNDPATGVLATSGALTTLTSRVTNTENTNISQGSAITALESTVNNGTTGVTATASALSTLTTRVTNVEGVNTSQASSISTLQTTVGGHTTSIQTNASSIDGIQGKYTVKIDNNGYVTGYGLISSSNDGTPTSEFMVVADKFSIAPVATNGDAVDGSPFFHLTTTTTVDGVSLPAGTYMKKAFITDLTSTNIRAASITADRLNVTLLSAISANLGTVTAGDIISATYRTSSTNVKRIDINYTTQGEMTFYGDRGDGSVVPLATIGIGQVETDYYVGIFGNTNAGNSRVGLFAGSSSSYGLVVKSETGSASYFSTNGSAATGVYVTVTGANAYGAKFYSNGTGGVGLQATGVSTGVVGSSSGSYGVSGLGVTGVHGSGSNYGGEFNGNVYGAVFNTGSYGSIKIGSRTSDPPGAEGGGMYFNSSSNRLKAYSVYISGYNEGNPILAGPSWVFADFTTT